MAKEKIMVVVGARPNFMKAAPLMRALKQKPDFEARLVHTGQHFDENMSRVFFEELEMPVPDVFFNINQKSHTQQVAQVMQAMEKELTSWRADLMIVVGDVNSTLAAGLVANQMKIKLAHVEAGLRSFDRTMPEEFNRLLVDQLADILFTPSEDADINLAKEGIPSERIFRVGNIMVDSLMKFRGRCETLKLWEQFDLSPREYGLVTLHRPSNVDDKETLEGILDALESIQREVHLFFPAHPRTRQSLERFGLLKRLEAMDHIILTEPQGYLETISMMLHSGFVITDSGGIQEESTVLGVPCLTVRENTERPVTITQGTNRLVGQTPEGILKGYEDVKNQNEFIPRIPELWDGKTAVRIVEILSRRKEPV